MDSKLQAADLPSDSDLPSAGGKVIRHPSPEHAPSAVDLTTESLQQLKEQVQERTSELMMAQTLLAEREEALKELETRLIAREAEAVKLAMVAARTDNAVVLTDPQGRIEWVNEGFTRLSGYTFEEARGRTPGSLLQGPGTDRFTVEMMRERIRRGEGFKTEVLNYHRCGRKYWVQVETQPVRDANGQLINFMAIESDITHRVHIDQRRSTQYEVARLLAGSDGLTTVVGRCLRAISRGLGWRFACFWRWEARTERLRLDQCWHQPEMHVGNFADVCRQLSFGPDEALPGQVWRSGLPEWVPDFTMDGDARRRASATSAGLHSVLAFPCRADELTLGIMEFFGSEVESPDQDLLRLGTALGNQIGQFIIQKQAEVDVQSQRDFAVQVMNLMGQALTITDASGDLVFSNAAFGRLVGLSADQLGGRSLTEFTVAEDVPTLRGARTRNLLGETTSLPLRLHHADGTIINAWVTGVPRRQDDFVTGIIESITDLTAQRRHEAILESAREAAEAASRAKSDFLAMMSHEIRTPMNGIIGMSGLLLTSPMPPQQREMIDAIRSSGEALMAIIEDVLDFSKIEAQKLDLLAEEFALDTILENVIDLLGHKAQQKGLTFAVIVAAEVPARLTADSSRIRQILLNLVGNAIKFTEHGEVLLEVRPDSAGRGVEFSVRDTGIGIRPDQLQRLFRPFSQADASTTRRYGGSGLGLVICQRLLELMDSRLDVASTEGEGSTFSFVIPQEGATRWSAPATRDRKILVGEGHPDARRSIATALASEGWQFEMVASELEWARRLESGGFDAALIDRNWFGSMAMEIVARLKGPGPTVRPRVALTGGLTDSLRASGNLTHIDGFIGKPLRRSNLRNWLENRETSNSGSLASHFGDSPAPPRRRLNILVAEDNNINRRLAVFMLETLGHRFALAANGREAVAAAMQGDFDVILMDCHMPEIDGYEAAQMIRRWEVETHRSPIVRIVALTAAALPGERERCLACGMNHYLVKPVGLEELKSAIECDDEAPAPDSDSLQREDENRHLRTTVLNLGNDLGCEEVAALIQDFLTEIPGRVAELKELVDRQEREGIRRQAHGLVGSCLPLGLRRVGELARELEQHAGIGTPSDQVRLASAIATAFAEYSPTLGQVADELRTGRTPVRAEP
jgi:PAS domain S-box-containing protein